MPDINTSYKWAVNTCNAPNVGYSQRYRNQRTVNGITYYDCSSFINYALLAGGWSTPKYAPANNPFTTVTEGKALTDLGFTEYNAGSSFEWKAGDIGWKAGHTEMCYQGGIGKAIFMGAHNDSAKLINQVSIGSSGGNPTWARGDFTKCYRYGDGSVVPTKLISTYVIAAMCANFWSESGVNPAIYESLYKFDGWEYTWKEVDGKGTGGYGLGQWTNTNGDTHGRLYKLHEWLIASGYSDDSLEGQLKYIIAEDNWHKGADWQQAIPYATLDDFLYSDSTDLQELTKAWMYCWEGIRSEGSLSERQDRVDDVYKYIIDHANDTTITTYYSGNKWLSEEERYNNCVMVYRLMGGTGGGGGTPTQPKRKGMPIWMMVRYR